MVQNIKFWFEKVFFSNIIFKYILCIKAAWNCWPLSLSYYIITTSKVRPTNNLLSTEQ